MDLLSFHPCHLLVLDCADLFKEVEDELMGKEESNITDVNNNAQEGKRERQKEDKLLYGDNGHLQLTYLHIHNH